MASSFDQYTDDSFVQPFDGYVSYPSDFSSENAEEGFALREWRRANAIRLEEKERREKELLSKILVEADEYKVEFHRKREVNCEANISANREKEKVFVESQEKFYAEADKDYWKSIGDLIPKEVLSIEKRKSKKEDPSAVVTKGPKPGKPTDLTRMRQILVKLKQNTPSHLKPSSPQLAPNANTDSSSSGASAVAVA